MVIVSNLQLGIKLSIILAALMLGACQTPAPSTYSDLPLTPGLLNQPSWQVVKPIEPLYPVEEAIEGTEGCASLSYVVTPTNQLTDVQVLHASSHRFAREARKAIAKWQWQHLPAGLLNAPVKSAVRFEFCLEDNSGHCNEAFFAAPSKCPGEDVLPVIGYRIKNL
ncbi:energy transducer TonB [Rheinheimera sp. UJ51]|uniref:energy transducer TonB n=1 Tax=unclassified Rheinheimera TaxID=115860 RepID=UPI001E64333C|nr:MULTISPECIES: energy transducer TonB [unclassified Rheinheimera]MCC5452022.1 energy transducer TonB [Rheinheimera sp. UJ51]MCF4009843.1 energy transducer TonB [Rheinheimera sp. UJ63]